MHKINIPLIVCTMLLWEMMLMDPWVIVGLLLKAYDFWREYKKGQNISTPEKHETIAAWVYELKTGNIKELTEIHQELIYTGNVELARKVNKLIESACQISEESYILIESYIESEKFYTSCKI